MVRARLATLALASSLGLVCGCMNLSEMPLLSRFRPTPVCCETGCCDAGCPVGCASGCCGVTGSPVGCANGCCGAAGEGPILEGASIAPPPALPPAPEVAAPFPAAPPRLVPAPQSAPMPYVPEVR